MTDKAGMLLLAQSVREHHRLRAIFPVYPVCQKIAVLLGWREKRKAPSPSASEGENDQDPDERSGRSY
jgi:hypothetical protein